MHGINCQMISLVRGNQTTRIGAEKIKPIHTYILIKMHMWVRGRLPELQKYKVSKCTMEWIV